MSYSNTLSRISFAASLGLFFALPAWADEEKQDDPAKEQSSSGRIVTSVTRRAQSIEESGSAVTAITGKEIEKGSLSSMKDVLRQVPGLSVSESGGKGGNISLRLRGAEARHTLVLIDGIRVTDPSTTGGEFDFSNLSPTDIERIEVLRGPQSALYGSDAMGGVVNIITKKGSGDPRFSADVEGGSYGTKSARASVSGSSEKFSYSLSVNGSETKGFSRWGYRIKRIEETLTQKLERDSAKSFGVSGRFGVDISDRTRLEFGGYANGVNADMDASFGVFPDVPSTSHTRLYNGYVRLTDEAFDKKWKNSLLVFGNKTDRKMNEYTYYSVNPILEALDRYRFDGERMGVEYQSDLNLDKWGILTFGAKFEREKMNSSSLPILDPFGFGFADQSDAQQDTRSLFAVYQISPMKNLNLTFSGRVDDVGDVDTFATWRTTAAYNVPDWGTTFRASIGTGAKAPSLYQFFSPMAGNADLEAETSLGMDAGVDQILFNGRGKLSATVFNNRFRDLIDFSFNQNDCPPSSKGGWGCYINVDRARTYGVEVSGDFELVPEWLKVNASYTWLDAKDQERDMKLARRPEHEGRLAFTITPDMKWTIEPSIIYVGERFSERNEIKPLNAYARLDMRVEYKAHKNLTLFVRGENLTDKRYEEIYDFGTPGRSVYGGMRVTW